MPPTNGLQFASDRVKLQRLGAVGRDVKGCPIITSGKKFGTVIFLAARMMGAFERNDLLCRNFFGVSDRLPVDVSKGRVGSKPRGELEGARKTVEQVS